MATVLERIEAMERAGAGVLVDQTLKKLAAFQLQKYQKHAEEVLCQLAPFEERYGMNSEECYRLPFSNRVAFALRSSATYHGNGSAFAGIQIASNNLDIQTLDAKFDPFVRSL